MTPGNIRGNGLRSLDVSCWRCHHLAILSAELWPDYVPVPTFGPQMVCTVCGTRGRIGRRDHTSARMPRSNLRHRRAPLSPKSAVKDGDGKDHKEVSGSRFGELSRPLGYDPEWPHFRLFCSSFHRRNSRNKASCAA
jgi:hypothetical protein